MHPVQPTRSVSTRAHAGATSSRHVYNVYYRVRNLRLGGESRVIILHIAPLLNFRNSGNPYAAPNVEFRGFVGRGRTVFMVFRDVWGDITMIPNNMILTLRRMIQPITNVIAQHMQQLQIQHTED